MLAPADAAAVIATAPTPGAELEFSGREFVERALVLEEDDLAERLTAGLGTEASCVMEVSPTCLPPW